MLFLFLDFDGVLHPVSAGENQLFCNVPLLLQAMKNPSDIKIVVSSNWRLRHSMSGLRLLLGEELGTHVVGATPTLSGYQFWPYRRQLEIETWLREHARPWDSWLALDDRPWEFRPFCSQLIVCDGDIGIDESVCSLLINRLAL